MDGGGRAEEVTAVRGLRRGADPEVVLFILGENLVIFENYHNTF